MTGARQSFKTADVLLVEVEADHVGLVNLVPNPDGSLGGWGWVTPLPGSAMSGGAGLTYSWSASTPRPNFFQSTGFVVTAGQYLGAAWTHSGPGYLTATFDLYDASDTYLYSLDYTPYTAAGRHGYPGVALADIVTNVATARLRFEVAADAAGNSYTAAGSLTLTDVSVVMSSDPDAIPTWPTSVWGSGDASGDFSANDGDVSVSLETVPNSLAATGTQVYALSTAGSTPSSPGEWNVWNSVGPASGATEYRLTLSLACLQSAGIALPDPSATVTFEWCLDNAIVSTTPGPSVTLPHLDASGWAQIDYTVTAPAGVNGVDLNLKFTDGQDPGYFEYLIDAVNMRPTTIPAPLGPVPGISYNNVTGVHNALTITRPALDVGVLSGTLIGEDMDPAVVDTIRPGRKVRVSAKAGGVWRPIFTGTTSRAQTSYHPSNTAGKRAKVSLTATDPCTLLAATAQPKGVATIADLPEVLEPAGVPWSVNGSPNGGPASAIVATDDNASVLDQLVRARDTAHAYVWVDRFGTVQAWDRDLISTDARPVTDADFNASAQIGYDTAACVTSITVTSLVDATTTTSGPFADVPALHEFGARTASYTINGSDDPFTWAGVVLEANAVPAVTLSQITIPLASQADLDGWAATDLYNLFGVSFTGSPNFTGNVRVTGVTHSITSDKWLLRLDLTADGRLPLPTS